MGLAHPHPRRAFTLIEVIIAVAILGIVTAIGWASLRDQLPRFHLVRTARTFKSDLMNLRNLAVESGRETRLQLLSSVPTCGEGEGEGGSWELSAGNASAASETWDRLPIDTENDATDDDASESLIDIGEGGTREAPHVCLKPWTTLRGAGEDTRDSIVFDPRARVSNDPSDFGPDGWLEFTFVNQEAARQGVKDELTVMISRAGMVRLVSSLNSSPTSQPDPGNPVGTGTSSSRP